MIEEKYPEITEFMDKCLYQEAAPTMEEAIEQYLVNGPDIIRTLLVEIDNILESDLSESEQLKYIERHSDYIENDSALDTLNLIKNVLKGGLIS